MLVWRCTCPGIQVLSLIDPFPFRWSVSHWYNCAYTEVGLCNCAQAQGRVQQWERKREKERGSCTLKPDFPSLPTLFGQSCYVCTEFVPPVLAVAVGVLRRGGGGKWGWSPSAPAPVLCPVFLLGRVDGAALVFRSLAVWDEKALSRFGGSRQILPIYVAKLHTTNVSVSAEKWVWLQLCL